MPRSGSHHEPTVPPDVNVEMGTYLLAVLYLHVRRNPDVIMITSVADGLHGLGHPGEGLYPPAALGTVPLQDDELLAGLKHHPGPEADVLVFEVLSLYGDTGLRPLLPTRLLRMFARRGAVLSLVAGAYPILDTVDGKVVHPAQKDGPLTGKGRPATCDAGLVG